MNDDELRLLVERGSVYRPPSSGAGRWPRRWVILLLAVALAGMAALWFLWPGEAYGNSKNTDAHGPTQTALGTAGTVWTGWTRWTPTPWPPADTQPRTPPPAGRHETRLYCRNFAQRPALRAECRRLGGYR